METAQTETNTNVDPAWREETAKLARVSETLSDTMRGPLVGVMQIDDKAATAIRYERTEKEGQPAYNVSFTIDNKIVAKLKGLDDNDLSDAVGDKNAKAIREAESDKGTLKGSALANEYGISPEENARRLAEKEQADTLEADEQNIVELEKEDRHKSQSINMDEALARIARVRELEHEKWLASTQYAQQADNKRLAVESLADQAQRQDDANLLAERTNAPTDYAEQVRTEREKNRQVELMQQVHQQFHVTSKNHILKGERDHYHFKDDPQKRIAFTDHGERMKSASNDDRVSRAMATMAEAKGWKTIRVSGHPDFKREVWMEASIRGIKVVGFKPAEKDLKELEDRYSARAQNSVEQEVQTRQDSQPPKHPEAQISPAVKTEIAAATVASAAAARVYSGRIVEHGEAPYNNDPQEKKSYFVKLATDKGEQTVWGVDLPRALAKSEAQTGDKVNLEFLGKQLVTVTALERDKAGQVIGTKEIQTNRNTWNVEKSDKAKVVEAVAAEMLKKQSPQQREAIMKAISTELEQREKTGKVPSVPIYDKSAPTTRQEAMRSRPQVERNAERTR